MLSGKTSCRVYVRDYVQPDSSISHPIVSNNRLHSGFVLFCGRGVDDAVLGVTRELHLSAAQQLQL